MTDERALRVAQAARNVGADWALLSSPDGVTYATQHTGIIETGPSPFAGGPNLAFVSANDADVVALVVNSLESDAAEQSHADRVFSYVGIALGERTPVEDRYRHAVSEAIRELGVGGTVAVEAATLTLLVGELLAAAGAKTVLIDRELDRARMTKTPAEIERLRYCAHLTTLGQQAALKATRPGRSELEIWADVRLAMELDAGERLPVAGDLTSGVASTGAISGWPTGRIIQEQDPVLCDLGARANGYWGDSCNTIFVGEPDERFMKLYRATQQSIEVILETLRPGISADEFDRGVRVVFERAGVHNPLHLGHGVGTGVHEWPRIVPGQDVMLEPGMVLMLEPGAYDPDVGGVRLEWMYLVTETGNEVLSEFAHTLHPG
jgi:Xaa-Pro dipeptidase